MDETKDPRINLNGRSDLAGVSPATVMLAQIDRLRSDGEIYADKLKDAGVAVDLKTFNGVTHEFFGMDKVGRGANKYAWCASYQMELKHQLMVHIASTLTILVKPRSPQNGCFAAE